MRVRVVIQVGNERGNRALKVNVIFPERVIGIEKQSLAGRESGSKNRHALRVTSQRNETQ